MRKTIKRLGAVLLAMAMAVSVLCTGALAAGTYTIKTGDNDTHTYSVYQIFTGTLAQDGETLSDIKWGKNGKNGNSTVTEGNAVPQEVLDALKAVNAEGKTNTDKLNVIKNYVNLNGQAYGTVTKDQQLSNVPAGYYLIKDSAAVTGNDAATNYIVQVVGNVTIARKTGVPEVDKKVNGKDTDTAQIGEKITFTLTGTLPDNYADYTKYQYEFHDTLSKGLTYNGDVKVYVKNGKAETELASTSYVVDPTNKQTTTPTNSTAITVKFTDLKANTVTGANEATVTISKDSEIIVKYSATLNENAVVGEAGNTNTVKLVYSNDPNGTSTGTTKDDKATVYTFQLNVTKVDGTNNTTKLAGAKFKLYYETTEGEETTTKHYAVVTTTTGENKDKITGWTTNEADGTVLITDDNGNITVKGLKEGTYYLEETEAPDGYNKLTAPVKVEITNRSNPIYELESVEADDKAGTVAQAVGTITIANNKGSTLPSTGGMGTKLFYTIGGILMAGAAIVLVVRKRRSDAE